MRDHKEKPLDFHKSQHGKVHASLIRGKARAGAIKTATPQEKSKIERARHMMKNAADMMKNAWEESHNRA